LLSQCHWRLVAETEAARRQLAMVVKSILDCLLYEGDASVYETGIAVQVVMSIYIYMPFDPFVLIWVIVFYNRSMLHRHCSLYIPPPLLTISSSALSAETCKSAVMVTNGVALPCGESRWVDTRK
jgi:hypothetical protein